MSKKKKKEINKKIKIELISIFIIFISTITLLSAGFVGQTINNIFNILFGELSIIILLSIIVYFIITMIYAEFKNFFTRSFIGSIIIYIGASILVQFWYIMKLFEGEIVKPIFQINSFINEEIVSSGGGLIGSIFYNLFSSLFGQAGTIIIATILIITGIIIITNFSISNYLKKQNSKKDNFIDKRNHTAESIPIENISVKQANISQKNENSSIMIHQMNDEKNIFQNDKEIDKKLKKLGGMNYTLPSINLLEEIKNKNINKKDQENEINKNSKILETTLKSFGIGVKVTNVHIGPTITKYELEPNAGVKVSKIAALSNDIAMSLAAKDIRIEAPIPGKAAVGIEIPNTSKEMIGLKELLITSQNKMENKLQVPLGKDISGNIIFCDISKMPHMLIAGATGSGKSICMNTIITSILIKATPEEVKLVLIDPKKVELIQYEYIPHLITPVISDPQKATMILKKMVIEMENRYEMFASARCKNIDSYNEKQKQENKDLMPFIVIIIDELADLMMTNSQEVETHITRLAQMARAAGIHLILATQRPSTDVITGLIKANIPSRISFSVASSIDSRTILDMTGAEKLLGKGDMLYLPQGENKAVRLQGSYLSDNEIQKIINFIMKQMQSASIENLYDEKLLIDSNIDDKKNIDKTDELFFKACEIIIVNKKASVSLLQRKLGIGYNRAARIIDQMENANIVGEHLGSKPRKVLISSIDEVKND